jgi:eukaryotic-like serine/threonine-protein kinase
VARDLIDELLEGRVKATLFGGDRAPRLGRLVILEPIGAGAMGTVFAAYDPRLDRKVAVKLVRSGDDGRILAEARALGKLAHPNVVAVHDAAEVDGAVYIVMELAPGASLRRWIGGDRRDWREVVGVMRQVALGLAAAHAAGLVHRDVKPDNILIGPDRVRLVDFGRAAPRDTGGETSAGTPHYMAPEVLAGGAGTPASDQFSFAVTLFEALHGVRPHTGADRRELAATAVTAATARPVHADVPGWLQAICVRALAADPGARFSSMTALVDELGRDRRRRQRLAAGAVAGLAALAATGILAYRGGAGDRDPCAGGDRARTALASATTAAQLRPALGDAPWVERAAADVREFADGWATSFRAVCEATRVRGAQSDTLYELRMRCLDRRLDRVSALASALVASARLAPAAADDATVALASLPRPSECEALVDPGELALPDDPAARAAAVAAEREVDRAWAAYALGRYADARAILAPVVAATEAHASARLLAASIEARAGDPATARARVDDALAAAARAKASDLEHAAWLVLLRVELFTGEPAKVAEYAPFARAAAVRAGLAGAELDGIVGEALRHGGDLAAARAVLARALASDDPLRGHQRALLEMNLGAVELEAGDPAAADAAFARALALAEEALGRDHPQLALYVEKHAAAALARGRVAEALAANDRVLALRRAAFGDDDRAVATARLRRAETLIEGGRLADAAVELAAARRIRAAVYGDAHVRLGEVELVAGELARAAGRAVEARAAFARAAALDPRIDVAAALVALGEPRTIAPLGRDEAPGVARAEAVAARIGSLPVAARPDEAAALVARWRARKDHAAPAIAIAAGRAALAAGDRAGAEEAFTAALAALAEERSRARLAALAGLGAVGDAHAGAKADELRRAMPELAR